MSENLLVKRLIWSGLVTAIGALTTIVSQRLAAKAWQRVFGEEPPE